MVSKVNNPNTNGRWLRKYKLFFIIGLLILLFQVLIAARFLELNNKEAQQEQEWQPQSQEPFAASNLINNDQNEKFYTSKQHSKNTNSNNLTVLRLEELEFKPQCEITKRETISAIHRAKTQKCKEIIANISCLSLAGKLYPKMLPSSCPHEGFVAGKSLGCFKDESSFRLLTGYYEVNKKNNSPEFCRQLCLQSGFQYAGVQYSNECFCGNEDPPSTSKLPDSSCNMKCPGDVHSTCGGYYTINIFQTGIKKFVAQVANTEVPLPNEKKVKIVFLLTLNGRALRQVKRLLKILYNVNHYYYIHVDIREDYLFRELLPLEKRFPNIHLTRNRFATIWGGASLLTMLLNCMQELLSLHPTWQWDFVLNLSESDYPVKTVTSLENFLTANRNKNFVKSHGRDPQRFLQKQGLDKTFVECEQRMWRVANRELPFNIQMDGGSDWVALSRDFVEFVAKKNPGELVAGLKQVFKHTLLPAESFFHTALRNSHFCNSYIDNNLHVTNWKRKLGCKCQYKHIVDWCGCSPNDFRPDDWNRIQTTQMRQLYFARKFEPIVNQAVLLKLELWLNNLEKPSTNVLNLHSYWQNVYHQMDMSPRLDDGLLTFSASIGRIWKRTFLNCSNGRSLSKPLEITSYHHKDVYVNTLIKFKLGEKVFEIGFKPLNNTILIGPTSFVKRVEELFVSSDYDQKEQMSRNFPRILSPYSEPMLAYHFRAINNNNNAMLLNLTLLWINPIGVLVDLTEIAIDENVSIGFSKPVLKQPLLPGTWNVILIQKQKLLAQVKFLVIPLEFYMGNDINLKQTNVVHGTFITKSVIDNYDQFLMNSNKRNSEMLEKESMDNVKKIGKDLQNWIDALIENYYVVERICSENKIEELCGIKVEHCVKSNWSSFAPDPKSAIGNNVNRTTGMFDIW